MNCATKMHKTFSFFAQEHIPHSFGAIRNRHGTYPKLSARKIKSFHDFQWIPRAPTRRRGLPTVLTLVRTQNSTATNLETCTSDFVGRMSSDPVFDVELSNGHESFIKIFAWGGKKNVIFRNRLPPPICHNTTREYINLNTQPTV